MNDASLLIWLLCILVPAVAAFVVLAAIAVSRKGW